MTKLDRLSTSVVALALPLVLLFTTGGIAVHRTVRPWLPHALPWMLALLVLSVGMATELPRRSAALPSLSAAGRSIMAGATALPALAWALSHLVSGPNRVGLVALALAPAEIASMATVSISMGDVTAAAGALVGSVLASAAAGGVAIRLLTGVHVSTLGIAHDLALEVLLPLAAGLALGSWVRSVLRTVVLEAAAVLIVAGLVGLVASELPLSWATLRLAGVEMVFVAGAYGLGTLFGLGLARPQRTAVFLTVGMRDFAIAAALATAAAGAPAAAPAAVFGVLVLATGTLAATGLRRREERQSAPRQSPGVSR